MVKTIPPSTYIVFSAKGEFPKNIINTWQDIWGSNMQRPYTADFEVYDENFQKKLSTDVEIYIALNP